MGSGINAARALDPIAARLMEDLRDQLLIVFLERLGGAQSIRVAEVDATGGKVLRIAVDQANRIFHFDVAADGALAQPTARETGDSRKDHDSGGFGEAHRALPEPEYPRDNAIARAIVQVWPDHRTRPTVHEALAFLALLDLGPGANVRTPGGAS